MEIVDSDIVIVGGGGAGLRAAIAIAEADPHARIALVSKVYPMRSHTVAAEGGAAGVVRSDDSLEDHFRDTVSGGEWLCDQDVVEYFVAHATEEMIRLENWGCPWSREADGGVAVRRFGGMQNARTWFAADRTGFHMLHTLFQTSLKHGSIRRFDEHFCCDLLVSDGGCDGALAIDIRTGEPRCFVARAVILATGGAGRLFRFNTNGAIVTGDGMGMAFRSGVPLQDLEFVQYHPTGLPGSGILITEGCRGEGGVLLNKDGYRYLQDYGLGPETPLGQPKNKTMELGPRDRLSQAFWYEQRAGRTVATRMGDAVHLDLRHLGKDKLRERLPLICELARTYAGVDPAAAYIPVRPAVHYTMGGIRTDLRTATALEGLFAVGECASIGLHGANRLGSNSLTELCVFGKVAGESALDAVKARSQRSATAVAEEARGRNERIERLRTANGSERLATIRNELVDTMDSAFGIFRERESMAAGLAKVQSLRARVEHVGLRDRARAFNTELLAALELAESLEVAQALATSALAREESRGAHQRLDEHHERDDRVFLQHTLVRRGAQEPVVTYEPVRVTRYPPDERRYGGPR